MGMKWFVLLMPDGKAFSRDRTKVVRLELDPLRVHPL